MLPIQRVVSRISADLVRPHRIGDKGTLFCDDPVNQAVMGQTGKDIKKELLPSQVESNRHISAVSLFVLLFLLVS